MHEATELFNINKLLLLVIILYRVLHFEQILMWCKEYDINYQQLKTVLTAK